LIVEMLGGRAWVDTEPEQGSIFSVLLPTISTAEMDRDVPGEK
jgi:signal transduction histidine kinase